jgi:hypothetical protein
MKNPEIITHFGFIITGLICAIVMGIFIGNFLICREINILTILLAFIVPVLIITSLTFLLKREKYSTKYLFISIIIGLLIGISIIFSSFGPDFCGLLGPTLV